METRSHRVVASDAVPRDCRLRVSEAVDLPTTVVLSKLLPEIVHSYGDCGRSLQDAIAGSHGHPAKSHLEPFRHAESESRFQKE